MDYNTLYQTTTSPHLHPHILKPEIIHRLIHIPRRNQKLLRIRLLPLRHHLLRRAINRLLLTPRLHDPTRRQHHLRLKLLHHRHPRQHILQPDHEHVIVLHILLLEQHQQLLRQLIHLLQAIYLAQILYLQLHRHPPLLRLLQHSQLRIRTQPLHVDDRRPRA